MFDNDSLPLTYRADDRTFDLHSREMPAAAISHARADIEERRRHQRFNLKLPGRYMLSDGAEFGCETIDVSPGGIAIRGARSGRLRERVVAYIDGLGRVEGTIARLCRDWFAVEVHAPSSKQERLAAKIGWLLKRERDGLSDRRRRQRVELSDDETVLRTTDGAVFRARLIDVSVSGAAILVDAALPLGAPVLLGDKSGHVSRHFPGGVAVTFSEPISDDIEETLSLVG